MKFIHQVKIKSIELDKLPLTDEELFFCSQDSLLIVNLEDIQNCSAQSLSFLKKIIQKESILYKLLSEYSSRKSNSTVLVISKQSLAEVEHTSPFSSIFSNPQHYFLEICFSTAYSPLKSEILDPLNFFVQKTSYLIDWSFLVARDPLGEKIENENTFPENEKEADLGGRPWSPNQTEKKIASKTDV